MTTIYSKAGTDSAISEAVAAIPAPDLSGYATAAEAAAAAPVQSVAGRTGAVVLGVADVSGAVASTDGRLSDDRTPLAHTHPASQVSDSTAVGRTLLTAASTPVQRLALGLFPTSTIVLLGDSELEITTMVTQLAALSGATCINCGIGGTRLSVMAGDYAGLTGAALVAAITSGVWTAVDASAAAVEPTDPGTVATIARIKAVNWATVDQLVIAYGTNDWASSNSLGARTDATSATFRGAANYVTSALSTAFPTMPLLLVTPTWRSRLSPGDGLDCDNNPNVGGDWLWQYADALIDAGRSKAVPVLDLFRLSGINAQTCATYTSDGLHWNDAGSLRVARILSAVLAAGTPTSSTYPVTAIGSGNIAVGDGARTGYGMTGSYNVAVGTYSQKSATSGVNNASVGYSALQNVADGSDNVAVGYMAGRGVTSGTTNVHVGSQAGYSVSAGVVNATTTATGQTVVGYRAGCGVTTQTSNITAVGYGAQASGIRGLALGANANVASGNTDSVALGANTTTTKSTQVQIGPRHIALGKVAAAPGVSGANSGFLYLRDDGSGKMQLVVQFPTGAVIALATEA